MRRLRHDIPLGLALADFHAARRELGPYYAFFAFRVLKDIGFRFGDKDGAPDWPAMNKALGTILQKRAKKHGTSMKRP